ncbi:MAG: hypothetical protein J5965_01655 [Aeriscardovia sp.]|nr:hypothetical protein [Aeriscardovia sp.]
MNEMIRKLKTYLGIRSPSEVYIAYLPGHSSLDDYEKKKLWERRYGNMIDENMQMAFNLHIKLLFILKRHPEKDVMIAWMKLQLYDTLIDEIIENEDIESATDVRLFYNRIMGIIDFAHKCKIISGDESKDLKNALSSSKCGLFRVKKR